jgi:hypothetical protein
MTVQGPGVPQGTTVAAITSDTAATLSQSCTNAGGLTLAFATTVASVSNDGNGITLSNAATAAGTVSLTFSRINAFYDLRVEETSHSAGTPTTWAPPRIDNLIVSGIARRGICIGDPNHAVAYQTVLSVGSIDLSGLSGAALDADYAMLAVNANTSPSTLGRNGLIGGAPVRIHDTGANYNNFVSVAAGCFADLGWGDTTRTVANPGTVLNVAGKCSIKGWSHRHFGGSGAPTPFKLNFEAGGMASVIGPVDLDDGGNEPSIQAVNLDNATDFVVGPISSSGYRYGAGVIGINGAQRGVLKLGRLVETTHSGWGLRFRSNANVRIEGGTISGMAKGVTGDAGSARCTATNCVVTGNTSDTDLASGQIAADAGCLNVTM